MPGRILCASWRLKRTNEVGGKSVRKTHRPDILRAELSRSQDQQNVARELPTSGERLWLPVSTMAIEDTVLPRLKCQRMIGEIY
jgi:hypothetical protein